MAKNITFEDAMSQLEKIVEGLENGNLSLDESLEKFQKGIELSNFCSKKLDEVEKKVNMLVQTRDGEYVEKPFVYHED